MATKRETVRKRKPIRVGVVGVGRGGSFASGATDLVGMKLVALCDTWEEKLLEEGKAFRIPDFREEAERKAFADDHWSPFPEDAGPGQPPPSIRGIVKPAAKVLAHARKLWKRQGYKGV